MTYRNRNDLYFSSILKLLKTYCFFLALFSFARLFFVIYFGEQSLFTQYERDIVHAFFIGWKYDTLVISYILTPFFFIYTALSMIGSIHLINFSNFFIKIFFWFISIIVPVVLIADIGFYSYFQDHINILFFGVFEDDTLALIETVWKNYPVVYGSIAALSYSFFSFFVIRSIFKKENNRLSFFHKGPLKFISMFIVIFILLAGGIRGGYGKLVLAPKYSDFSENQFVNHIAINGFVALEKTIKLRNTRTNESYDVAESMGYKNNLHGAFSDYLGIDVSPTKKEELLSLVERITAENHLLEETKPNVIVFAMESFGSHWLKYNSDNFNFLGDLKKHFSDDFYFENIISSDNGTIGSLLTLGTNIPNRNGARFLSESKYMRVPLRTAAQRPYTEKGYHSTFVYGGKLAWRDIGRYFGFQKFDELVGENKIKKTLNLSGRVGTEWGVYDEHFFNSIYQMIEKRNVTNKPQFILGLSTTNHPPFEVPKTFKKLKLKVPDSLLLRISREKKLFIERFEAFQYSNVKLAEFISKIKKSKHGKNTIIAVTGDHNFWGFMNYSKEEAFSKYKVPFYVYIPEHLREGIIFDPLKFGSHEDIMTSLYNISLSKQSYLTFGDNLFSNLDSFSFNSNIKASSEGAVYGGKSYKWSTEIGRIQDVTQESFIKLDKRFRSTMTIADHLLKMSAKATKKN